MAAIEREKFSSQVTPDLLIKMREIARNDGRQFQTVVEDAFRQYIESRSQSQPRGHGPFLGQRGKKPAAW